MGKEYVKNYQEQIKNIQEKQKEIDEIIASLPESSWQQSLKLSSVNFNKKLDAFLSKGGEITEEQRELIRKIKRGEISAAEVLASVGGVESKPEEFKTSPSTGKGKGKGKKEE